MVYGVSKVVGHIGIIKNNMETTILYEGIYWSYIGIMEMETTISQGLGLLYDDVLRGSRRHFLTMYKPQKQLDDWLWVRFMPGRQTRGPSLRPKRGAGKVAGLGLTWAPKVCEIMAFMATIMAIILHTFGGLGRVAFKVTPAGKQASKPKASQWELLKRSLDRIL